MLCDKEAWQSSKPGYITKTIKHGPATVTLHKPDLEPNERDKRERQTIEILSHSLRGYLTK
jgi:hypothetical protein